MVVLLGMIIFGQLRLAGDPRGFLLWSEGFEYTVLALTSAGLIAWSLQPGSVCRWLFEMAPMRFLGKYSYGIYVLHVLVLSAMNLPLRAALRWVADVNLMAVKLLAEGTRWVMLDEVEPESAGS